MPDIQDIGDFLEPIYLDGVLSVVNLGPNFGTTYFRWRLTPGGVYERNPALFTIRPKSAIQSGILERLLVGQNAPETPKPLLNS